MELIENLEYAVVRTAETVRAVLGMPCFWFKDVTFGQLLIALIVIGMIMKLFWEILR